MKKADKIIEYYKNPKRCIYCGKIIDYDGVEPLHKAFDRQYCSISCVNKVYKKKPVICGIYCIENLVNHKKYIGQSKDIFKRWRQHRSELNTNIHYNSHLQNY